MEAVRRKIILGTMKYLLAIIITIAYIAWAATTTIEMPLAQSVLVWLSFQVALFVPYFFVEHTIQKKKHSALIAWALGMIVGSLASIVLNLVIFSLAAILRLTEIPAGSFGYHDTIFGEILGLVIFGIGIILFLMGLLINFFVKLKKAKPGNFF